MLDQQAAHYAKALFGMHETLLHHDVQPLSHETFFVHMKIFVQQADNMQNGMQIHEPVTRLSDFSSFAMS